MTERRWYRERCLVCGLGRGDALVMRAFHAEDCPVLSMLDAAGLTVPEPVKVPFFPFRGMRENLSRDIT